VQLHQRGHRVSFLGLLDTVAPGFQPRFTLVERVVGGVRRRWLELLKTMAPLQPHDDSAAQLDERGVVSEYSSALQHLLLNAEMAYQPTAPCPLPIDLFVAQDTARRAPEVTLGWRAHSPAGVRRHYVASERHLDIVSPLHASDVARALNACLARVVQESSVPVEHEPTVGPDVFERAERRA
jgi:thioesterase domain-containing protein